MLYVLKLNEIKRDNKDTELPKIFYDRFKKEFSSLSCQELTESTIIFYDYISDQSFLNEIQHLIINYEIEVDKNNYNDLLLLFNRLVKKRNLNLDILFESFINNILKNFVILNSDTQVKVLSAYTLYYLTHTNPNTNTEVSKKMDEKIKKLFKYGENEMMNCVRNLKMDECIEVLNAFFQVNLGSSELFEEIEKHIGLNIQSLSPDRIFIVLNTFVLSGKMRNKFTLLLQKRIVDIKQDFKINELAKILRIYTSIETQYEYIYEKCENYFLSVKEYLSPEDLANLVFAYSNPHIKGKYFILNDLEEVILNKLDLMVREKTYEAMVDILYSYLICKKGASKFIDRIFSSLINREENLNLSSTGLFKLYYIFVQMKTSLSITVRYDNFLLERLVSLKREELIAVNTFLRQLNYSNIDTLTLVDNFTKLEMSGLTDEDKRIKKVQILQESGIKPIYDYIRF